MKYHESHRHATWLELFFDLVFVAAISVVTHQLAHLHDGHLDSRLVMMFPVAFVPVWWIWSTHTLFANRFDTDGPGHRVATLVLMFLITAMASSLGENLFEHYGRLIAFYVVIRLVLAGMYFAAARRPADALGAFARDMGLASVAGAAISGSSLLAGEPLRQVIFLGGILFEMVAVVVISRRATARPVHRSHLVERVGLLSIILLGESVISLVGGLQDITWTPPTIAAAATGFVLIGSIWWIYFDSFDILERTRRLEHGFIVLYSNVLFCMGLALLANLIRHTIVAEISMHDFRILAISGMLLFYLGKQTMYYALLPVYRPNILINSTVCLVITIASSFLPRPEQALVGMTLGLLFYVYSNLRWTLTKDASSYLLASDH
ncbi:MAG: low temperature requirement protein A [Acidobacteriota bacterium]